MLALLNHEIRLELKRKYALNGILLYLLSTVFICFLAFQYGNNQIDINTWNTLFWIIVLFNAINAVAKTFLADKEERFRYYYQLLNPIHLIISRMIYNSFLTSLLAVLSIALLALFLPLQEVNFGGQILISLISCMGFASCLTLTSMLSAKAGNNFTLMAILSFPVIIPILLMAINASIKLARTNSVGEISSELLTIIAVTMISWVAAVILFPYLWKN